LVDFGFYCLPFQNIACECSFKGGGSRGKVENCESGPGLLLSNDKSAKEKQ